MPDHKTLDRGTLGSILRSVGLTAEQFRELLLARRIGLTRKSAARAFSFRSVSPLGR
jgi:hypothetical protein